MIAYSGDAMHIEGWRFPVIVDLEGLMMAHVVVQILRRSHGNKAILARDNIKMRVIETAVRATIS